MQSLWNNIVIHNVLYLTIANIITQALNNRGQKINIKIRNALQTWFENIQVNSISPKMTKNLDVTSIAQH